MLEYKDAISYKKYRKHRNNGEKIVTKEKQPSWKKFNKKTMKTVYAIEHCKI